jgi:LysR family transcriptional activator of nhaA
MYNFNHLYYFYITVKSEGVTTAAEHLSISQPSLSSQIKVLETFLDIKLFRKIGRKNKLTPEGSIVFGFCRQMFELSEEMHELVTQKLPNASRRICIGVSKEVANSFVVEVISLFLTKFNGPLRPKVSMISNSHERLVEQLRFREIDAIVSHFPTTIFELENIVQGDLPVNLIYSAKKKLPTSIRKTDLTAAVNALAKDEEASWVMPSANFKLRTEVDLYFEEQSLKGRIVFESDVIESLIRSIVDDIGVGLLPLIYVPKEISSKSLFKFGPRKGFWKHKLWLTCHSQAKEDHLIRSLGQSFKEACRF